MTSKYVMQATTLKMCRSVDDFFSHGLPKALVTERVLPLRELS